MFLQQPEKAGSEPEDCWRDLSQNLKLVSVGELERSLDQVTILGK